MAAYNNIGQYDAKSIIPEFRGLMQHGGGINSNPCYATEAENVETKGGVLQPAAACTLLTPQLTSPIETLARLYRRWNVPQGEGPVLLVAASGGKLYAMTPGAQSWTQLPMPDGVTSYASNAWSWVTYEINLEGSNAPIDVLLLSNAQDGMIMVRGDTGNAVTKVTTPKKFGVIARYAERIWGGAITDDPDMLVYSAPFDPTDWEADVDNPEDGAGDIMQPSWDGDHFTAIHQFGSQLIAFKTTRVWRVLGTDPGEYAFKEQYGGGAPYARTIAVDTERIFMLTRDGVMVYDGLAVHPFQQDAVRDVIATINPLYVEKATACLWKDKYYLSIPLGTATANNAVLIYNTQENTWLLRKDVCVESFLATPDKLYFTSSTTPGKIWEWKEDSWETGEATGAATKWVSPWTDLSAKYIVKGSFEVYFLMEIKDSPATLRVSIQTEKKVKTKEYTLKPLTIAQRQRKVSYKQKRLHFGGSGRRFRVIIESKAGQPVWRIIGGMQIISEIDPD